MAEVSPSDIPVPDAENHSPSDLPVPVPDSQAEFLEDFSHGFHENTYDGEDSDSCPNTELADMGSQDDDVSRASTNFEVEMTAVHFYTEMDEFISEIQDLKTVAASWLMKIQVKPYTQSVRDYINDWLIEITLTISAMEKLQDDFRQARRGEETFSDIIKDCRNDMNAWFAKWADLKKKAMPFVKTADLVEPSSSDGEPDDKRARGSEA